MREGTWREILWQAWFLFWILVACAMLSGCASLGGKVLDKVTPDQAEKIAKQQAVADSLRIVIITGVGCILAGGVLLWMKWPSPAIIAFATGVGLIVLGALIPAIPTWVIATVVLCAAGMGLAMVYGWWRRGRSDE